MLSPGTQGKVVQFIGAIKLYEQIAFNNARVKIARLDNLSGSRSFGHKWLNYLISSLISGT